MKRPRRRQLGFSFRTWGGRRKGAGRPPKGARAGVSHRSRPRFERPSPVHVTMRMGDWVWNLRSRRSARVLEDAMRGGGDRFGARVLQASVQGNHIHLLVEAEHTAALARGMQGLSVRIAKGMNGLMRRKGRVFADRYHAHVLRTPTEVRHAIHYIRDNRQRHAAAHGEQLPAGWVDPFALGRLEAARTWLVRTGWRRRMTGQPPPGP